MAVLDSTEVQNRRSRGQLPKYFQGILDAAREGIAIVGKDLQIVVGNRLFHQMIGSPGQTGPKGDSSRIVLENPELRAIVAKGFSQESETGVFDVRTELPGLGQRVLAVTFSRLPRRGRGRKMAFLSVTDMTETSDLRERLRQEIERCGWMDREIPGGGRLFQVLIESMNDGLAVRNKKGQLTYVNQKLSEMLEYPREQILLRPVTDFLDPENRQIYEANIKMREQGLYDAYELIWISSAGRKVHTLMSPKPLYNSEGRVKGSFAIVIDITDRKRIETALRESEEKLRLLSNHLLRAQENEREYISRELHDELGQDLAVLKYQVRFIERRLRREQKQLVEACRDTLQHIDHMVENIRRISRRLGPYNLEHLGLTASLERIAEDFSKHSRTGISLDIQNIDSMLSQESAVGLYRIFQEALTNIGRHAQATEVTIRIAQDNGRVVCSIRDNGRGFSTRPKGIGLAAMEQRTQMMGGTLEIQSQQGAGTWVLLTFPVNGKERGKADGTLQHSLGRRSPDDPPGYKEDYRGKAGAGSRRRSGKRS